LHNMLASIDILTTMGIKGRQHVEEHYTLEREAMKLCEFFRQLE